MFDYVATPEPVRQRSRSRSLATLPISILTHSVIIAGAVAASIWVVEFPQQPPIQTALYSLVEPPAPPPPPPPPPSGNAVKPIEHVVTEVFTPTVIPDLIPDVPVVSQVIVPAVNEGDGVPGGVEGGVAGGVIGGTLGGVLGGVISDKPTGPLRAEVDVKMPHFRSQVFPEYPEAAQLKGIQGTVIVEYLIGKDGKVKEVKVIEDPQPLLTKAALKAVWQWKFVPTVVKGEAVEVIHKTAINFVLE